MATITVVYWNIQNFGTTPPYKADYAALCSLIASVMDNTQADILCIQELRQSAILTNHLQLLLRELCALPAPRNNWYYDWIKGAIRTDGLAVAPYATANDLDWDSAHYEGYAVFWNQNIAKFMMQPSPPITPPGGGMAVPNTQSEIVRTRGIFVFGVAAVPVFGIALPAGGIAVPAGPGSYVLPVGTTAPPGAAINNGGPGGAVVLAAGGVLAANANIDAGTILPVGTVIGPTGLHLNAQTYNVNPVVVPGNYTLTDTLTLPAAGTVVVPEHSMSLVLTGRDTTNGGAAPSSLVADISGITAPFNAGGVNNWQYLYFTRGAGQPASLRGCRRPAYVTIDVNSNALGAGAAQRLIPVITYHAPSAAPASSVGMQRASYSQPLYQAYDPGAAAWIDNTFAVLGGDVNAVTDAPAYAYQAFTNGFGAGGAACQIRVYNPAPPPTVANPAPTRADNVLNKSTAQINSPPVGGAPIVSGLTNDYRLLAIDNVFYRGFAVAQAPLPIPAVIYDLLLAVTLGGGPFNITAPIIQPFRNIPIFNFYWTVFTGAAMLPGPATPNIQNIDSFVVDLNLGNFFGPGLLIPPATTAARRGAEFIHLCVSDHLPVIFTMNL